MSPNYDYVVAKLEEITARADGRQKPAFLDFGCGSGLLMETALAKGLDIYGADTYPDALYGEDYEMKETRPDLAGRISKIENDKLPYADNSFDGVVANMVFEHVEHPEKPFREIARVLKSGGLFLVLVPTEECLWEGHAGLFWAHRMKPYSRSQYVYLKTMKALGLAGKKPAQAAAEWARYMQTFLATFCFYHTLPNLLSLYRATFGKEPERWEHDYMLYRLNRHKMLKALRPVFDNKPGHDILRQICRRRAVAVFAVYKGTLT